MDLLTVGKSGIVFIVYVYNAGGESGRMGGGEYFRTPGGNLACLQHSGITKIGIVAYR